MTPSDALSYVAEEILTGRPHRHHGGRLIIDEIEPATETANTNKLQINMRGVGQGLALIPVALGPPAERRGGEQRTLNRHCVLP